MANSKTKTCDHCGKTFECGPGTGDAGHCWCASYPHVMPLEEGKDCLCLECLETEIQKHDNST